MKWHSKRYYIWTLSFLSLIFLLSPMYLIIKTARSEKAMKTENLTPTTAPTCVPRPLCLDANPKCLIPETPDMCPRKEIDEVNPKYSCPENGWVNCMPGPANNNSIACSREAEAWYEANCPDFEGIAY